MTEQEKQALLRSPDLFIARYFPESVDDLEDFHLRLIETATQELRGLILYPAAHGKTTLVSTLLPIWAMCRDPNIRIAVIAKNDHEAKAIARVIMAELTSNQELIRDFGPFAHEDRGRAWNMDAIEIDKRTIRAKEPTIAFFGAGAKTTLGHRTDWTICDDVVTQENSNTPDQRAKMKEWFNQAARTMARFPSSRITVVGTLFDPEDLYNDLILMTYPDTGEEVWKLQREDAIVDEEEHITLWVSRWPWKRLMELKAEMGTLDFNKRFRNIAVDKSRQVFKEEYVKGGYIGPQRYPGCLDRGYSVGDYDDAWLRYTGFDPAIGTSRKAKFCAHVTLAVGSCKEHDRCFWVVDLLRGQMTSIQQTQAILEQHEKYDAFKSIIEANGYQMGLYEAVERRMMDAGQTFKVEPHVTGRNKIDPELGVQAMAPFFENGLVHIPWGNPESSRKMKHLVDELIEFPGRTTDTVMAFWFAWRAAQEGAPRFRSFNRLREPKMTSMGRRTRSRMVKNPYYVRESA